MVGRTLWELFERMLGHSDENPIAALQNHEDDHAYERPPVDAAFVGRYSIIIF